VNIVETIALTCPNCEAEFSSQRLDAGNIPGQKATDFRLCTNGIHPLPYAVHLCEQCGFAGPEEWFANGHVSFEVRRHVWDEITPRLDSHAVLPSEKYEFAAKVATWDGASPRQIADLWLRAAWCCVDEHDPEAERFYRRHAAWSFAEALETYDGIDRNSRAVITYLVGELWRRIGDVAQANAWFDRVQHEVVDSAHEGWIVQWAKRQHDDPLERFV